MPKGKCSLRLKFSGWEIIQSQSQRTYASRCARWSQGDVQKRKVTSQIHAAALYFRCAKVFRVNQQHERGKKDTFSETWIFAIKVIKRIDPEWWSPMMTFVRNVESWPGPSVNNMSRDLCTQR